jgi:hypothetical protein
MLKKQNFLQVPKLVRSQFKVEPSEVIEVTVSVVSLLGAKETFLARMLKDGRVAVPRLALSLLRRNEPNIEGFALEITLKPICTNNQ